MFWGRSIRWIMLGLLAVGCFLPAPARAEPHGVAGSRSGHAAAAASEECVLEDELAREQVFDAIERVQAKLLIGVEAFPIRSQIDFVHGVIEFELNDRAKELRDLMLQRQEYWRLFLQKTAPLFFKLGVYTEEERESAAFLVAAAPSTASIALGTVILKKTQRYSLRLTGKFLLLSGIVGGVLSVSGGSLSESSLKASTNKLTPKGQAELQKSVYGPLENMVHYLSDILAWPKAEEARFRKQLQEEIFNGIVKQVQRSERRGKIQAEVVAGALPEIDLLDFLKRRRFITPAQIAGLKQMEELRKLTTGLSESLSPDEAVSVLARKTASDSHAALATIREMVRLRALMASIPGEEGAKGAAVNGARRNILSAIDRDLALISEFCKLGAFHKEGKQ